MKTTTPKHLKSEFTKVQRRKLIQELSSIVEKAYRRGFQHGVMSDVSNEDAFKFRYTYGKVTPYIKSPEPPFKKEPVQDIEKAPLALERLIWDASDGHHDNLLAFVVANGRVLIEENFTLEKEMK